MTHFAARRHERVRIARLHVVDRRHGALGELAHGRGQPASAPLAPVEFPRCEIEPAHDVERLLTFFDRKVPVARAHCQTVSVAHDRMADDLDRQEQIADHPPHDQELLVVLASEDGGASADHAEELCDDGRYSLEVPRPKRPLERYRQDAWMNARLIAGPIYLLRFRCKDDVHVEGRKLRQVAFDVARVAREILVGAELGGIDEDRNDDEVRPPLGFGDERKVAIVQSAHRWNEAHGAAAGTRDVAGVARVGNRANQDELGRHGLGESYRGMAAGLINSVAPAGKTMVLRRSLHRSVPLVAASMLAGACGSRGPLYVSAQGDAGGSQGAEAGTPNPGSDGSNNNGDATTGLAGVDATAVIACSVCLAQKCGTELLACVTAPACGMTFQCAASMCLSGPAPDGPCVLRCANGDPQSVKMLTSAVGCVAGACPECVGLLAGFARPSGS